MIGEMNVRSIAGEKILSRISPEFEAQVAEMLNPIREYEEDIILGSNIMYQVNAIYGFCILTSSKLMSVYFAPMKKEPATWHQAVLLAVLEVVVPIWNRIMYPLLILIEVLAKIFSGDSRKRAQRRSKFETEGLDRRVNVHELADLEAVKTYIEWEGDEAYTSITLEFRKSEEMSLTFLVEQDAHQAKQLLETYLKTGRFA